MGIMDNEKNTSETSNDLKSPITNRGRKWELKNSRWIVWAFLPGLNFIAFLVIGIKAKNLKWILYGEANLLCFLLFFIFASGIEEHTVFTTTLALLFCMLFYYGIYLAFKWRKEYLIRREILLGENKGDIKWIDINMGKSLISKFEVKPNLNSSVNVENLTPEYEKETSNKLDINKCLESELIDLPGISVVTAKKIVNYCDSNNGFNSFDEFIELMDIKPHFAIQLKDLVIVIPRDKKINNSSRKLDI